MKCDIVVDNCAGDSGKGKVVLHLLKTYGRYTHVVKPNSGANCGHTVYHNGKKIVTHMVPMGVVTGVKSLIAPNCVLNVKGFFQEIEQLEKLGISAAHLVKISTNTHIVEDRHIEEEKEESRIGSTKMGIGPCYRDKASRIGIRAESIPELKPFLVDFHDEIFTGKTELLLEGSQGFMLDISLGDYPYVTSSSCIVTGMLSNGIPHSSVRNTHGVIKAYETYVGAKKFEGDDPIFAKMREVGNEFGATTSRPRQCNYLNIDNLVKANLINDINILVVNKMDVLKELNCWKVRFNDGRILDLQNESNFKNYLNDLFPKIFIHFSYSPEIV